MENPKNYVWEVTYFAKGGLWQNLLTFFCFTGEKRK